MNKTQVRKRWKT